MKKFLVTYIGATDKGTSYGNLELTSDLYVNNEFVINHVYDKYNVRDAIILNIIELTEEQNKYFWEKGTNASNN